MTFRWRIRLPKGSHEQKVRRITPRLHGFTPSLPPLSGGLPTGWAQQKPKGPMRCWFSPNRSASQGKVDRGSGGTNRQSGTDNWFLFSGLPFSNFLKVDANTYLTVLLEENEILYAKTWHIVGPRQMLVSQCVKVLRSPTALSLGCANFPKVWYEFLKWKFQTQSVFPNNNSHFRATYICEVFYRYCLLLALQYFLKCYCKWIGTLAESSE